MRRSDKYYEARFFEIEDYMAKVDEFYAIYLIKNPDKVNQTQRTVFVASDEATVFKQLVEK